MVVTSLRAYLDYIEDRLNRDAYPEVVAQCRHLLEQFPRNLDTYRLLVRALVSQQNYTDGFDLSQRILSADPNDFIAHISISECYRESGSINQAIWHLERAFEQAPSNQNLQDEIKALYTAKGLPTPRKIRLTSGALARLYARGRLYPQAIKELEKAISQDSERLDLQALLATVLWESHYEIRAGRVAAEVYKRLPFSLDANRILALMWLNVGNKDEAQPFLARVREIDPYLAYEIENNGQKAPADIVNLPRLDYASERGSAHTESADWVTSIDSIEVSQTGGLTPPRQIEDFSLSGDMGTGSLPTPDWLEKALNAPISDSPGEQRPFSMIEDVQGSGTPHSETIAASVRAGTTGWLDELFTSGERPSGPPLTMMGAADKDNPDWLNEVLEEEQKGASTSPPIPPSPPAIPETPLDETSSWLGDIVGSDTSSVPYTSPEEVNGGTTPFWLKEAMREQKKESPQAAVEEDSDEWLQDLVKKEDEIHPFGPIETPPLNITREDVHDAWEAEYGGETQSPLHGTPDTETSPEFGVISPPEANADMPDWMRDQIELAENKEFHDNEDVPETPEDELPQWLSELDPVSTAEDGISTRPLNEKLGGKDDRETPSFDLAELFADVDSTEAIQEGEKVSAPYEEPNDDENPEMLDIDWDSEEDAMAWLEGLAADLDPNFESSSPVAESPIPGDDFDLNALLGDEISSVVSSSSESGDLPDWLSSESDSESAATVSDDDPFAWLNSELDKQGFSSEQSVSEAAEPDIPPMTSGTSPLDGVAAPASEEDLPSWLKDIEEKGPAIDTGLTEIPIEEDELAWLDESLANAPRIDTDELSAIFDLEEAETSSEPEAIQAEEEELPDWLFETTGVGIEREEIEPALELGESDDLPDWLKDISASEEPEAEPVTIIVDEETLPDLEVPRDTELPAWLNQPRDEAVTEEPVGSQADEEVPDWMKEITFSSDEPIATIEETPQPVFDASDEDLPEWLREQEFEEEIVTTPEVSEQAPVSDIPDWMLEMEEEVDSALEEPAAVASPPITDEPEPVAFEDDEELPEWLQEPETLKEAAVSEEASTEWSEMVAAEEEIVSEIITEEEPDWLSDLTQPVEASTIAESEEEDEMPVWLRESEAEMVEEEEAETEVEATIEEEEVPDWLAQLEEEEEEEELPEPMPRAKELWGMPLDEEVDTGEPELLEPELVEEEIITEISAREEPRIETVEAEDVIQGEIEAAVAAESLPIEPVTEAETVDTEEPVVPEWLRRKEPAAETSAAWPGEKEEEQVRETYVEITPAAPVVPGPAMTTSIFSKVEADESPIGVSELLIEARNLMAEGAKVESLNAYEKLVNQGEELDVIVSDMRALIDRGPVKPQVYRLVGDALMAQGDLQEALKMYHHALDHL